MRNSAGFTLTTHCTAKKNEQELSKKYEQIPLGEALKQLLVKAAAESVSSTWRLITSEHESKAHILRGDVLLPVSLARLSFSPRLSTGCDRFTLQNDKGVTV